MKIGFLTSNSGAIQHIILKPTMGDCLNELLVADGFAIPTRALLEVLSIGLLPLPRVTAGSMWFVTRQMPEVVAF